MTATLLLAVTAAHASHWVSDFDGSAQQYKIIRHEATVMIEQLMALQPGDTIIIDDPAGRVLIIDQRNQQFELTVKNTPFVVPESVPQPRFLTNVRNWVSSWWNTRGNQTTSTISAVSRGGLEPEILVATRGENFLLSGRRELHVIWSGGIQPFDVSLVAESGKLLGRRTDVPGFSVSLPSVEINKGQFKLVVAAGAVETHATLTAVSPELLPEFAGAILDLDLPDKIRFGNLAMLLSAYDSWRFEALQLARSYNLRHLELDLLSGNIPESDIHEMKSMPELSELLQ